MGFELAADGKSGAAVEVKCETDFVARGDKFQGFVKDMVAQVAKGEYADSEALLAAPFVADASVTVKEALDGVIATTGENMGLGKFAKMELAAGKSGLIGGYLHSNGKLAVLVEMQTGSDAAAASEAFHELAKNVAMQIAAASPLAVSAEGLNPLFFTHVALVSVLLIYFPFSKLMHMGGIFLSPTRNMRCNTREVRHVNPWNNPDAPYRTYAEYEDDFRDLMAEAGLPLEKQPEDVEPAAPAPSK